MEENIGAVAMEATEEIVGSGSGISLKTVAGITGVVVVLGLAGWKLFELGSSVYRLGTKKIEEMRYSKISDGDFEDTEA